MLQRTVGNQAVQALLARERRLERDVGWTGTDVGPGSPNRGSTTVKGTEVKRVPVQGVKGGHEDSDLGTKMHDPETGEAGAGPEVRTRTHELPGGGGGGRAIVLIPQWLPELDTVEVLFFLHGHMVGYREHGGEVDDKDLYRFEQQLQAVKPRPMIAILPQGGFYSEFGAKRKDVDVNSYIANVLPLVPASEWPNGPPRGPGGVVVSGHSGAGAPIASMLTEGEMPAGDQFEGLILFDSINTGPAKKKGDEYTPVRDAVLAHVDHDLKQLAPLKTAEDQAGGSRLTASVSARTTAGAPTERASWRSRTRSTRGSTIGPLRSTPRSIAPFSRRSTTTTRFCLPAKAWSTWRRWAVTGTRRRRPSSTRT